MTDFLLHFFSGQPRIHSPAASAQSQGDIERLSGDFQESVQDHDDSALGISDQVIVDEGLGIGGSAI